MRRILALAALALALAASPAAARPAHYDVDARIDAAGRLSAEVVIDLPAEAVDRRTEFLLGDRFEVGAAEAGPGATISYEPTDKPIAGLRKVVIEWPERPRRPVRLRFRYGGPLNAGGDAAPAFTRDAVELRLEGFWIPIRSDITLLYTVDAEIRGLAQDLVVVSQGRARRTGDVLAIRRALPDLDVPLVAVRDLRETATPGMAFYGPAGPDPLVTTFRAHAVGSARFLQDWLGPIPNGPTRIAVIPRVGGSSYARRGYIVISRPLPNDPDKTGETANARHVAHEFAHAWFLAADPMTEHYWLTESLAEYCAIRYVEATLGPAARDELLAAKVERARTAGPVLGGGRPTRAALYQKAPLLLFDLERRIGRPAMDRILQGLARRPPRTTPEFLGLLEEAAGPDAARDFEAALRA